MSVARKRAEEKKKWGRTAHRGALMAADIPPEKTLAAHIAEACFSHQPGPRPPILIIAHMSIYGNNHYDARPASRTSLAPHPRS